MAEDVRRHAYKMTSDSNCAPCVHRGVLTIALCKPRIRQRAPQGSWVYGFAAPELGHRVLDALAALGPSGLHSDRDSAVRTPQ
jgi:hypothetical protein